MIPHHYESLSPVVYLVQTQIPLIPSSTQKRQAFLVAMCFQLLYISRFAQVPNPVIVFYLFHHIIHQV